jgi:hypothetical protein
LDFVILSLEGIGLFHHSLFQDARTAPKNALLTPWERRSGFMDIPAEELILCIKISFSLSLSLQEFLADFKHSQATGRKPETKHPPGANI